MGIDHYASDGSSIVGVYFVYDSAGRIVRNRRDGTMTYYEYDANGRLTAERLNNGADAYEYAYDKAGNRIRQNINGDLTYYYYSGDNSLHKHVAAGVTTYYDYDAAGSLTKIHASGSGATYFEYDAAGRTSGIVPETPVSAAPALAIHYDADGALFHATEDDGSSAAENYFYYDKTSSNLELLARRRDGDLDYTFLHGPSRVPGIGTVAEYERSGTVFVPHMDHRGTAMAWSSAGTEQSQTTHNAFGQIIARQGTPPLDAFEMSYQSDWLLAHHQPGQLSLYLTPSGRIYHTGLGRFLQRDPIEYLGGIDLYNYAISDPLGKVDAYGEEPEEDIYDLIARADWHDKQLGKLERKLSRAKFKYEYKQYDSNNWDNLMAYNREKRKLTKKIREERKHYNYVIGLIKEKEKAALEKTELRFGYEYDVHIECDRKAHLELSKEDNEAIADKIRAVMKGAGVPKGEIPVKIHNKMFKLTFKKMGTAEAGIYNPTWAVFDLNGNVKYNKTTGFSVDYHRIPGGGNNKRWHYNVHTKYGFRQFTDIQDHSTLPSAKRIGTSVKYVRKFGRIALWASFIMDGLEIIDSFRKGNAEGALTSIEIALSWGGAAAGSKLGGYIGATIGAMGGGPAGAMIGGGTGALFGAMLLAYFGEKTAELMLLSINGGRGLAREIISARTNKKIGILDPITYG